MSEDTTKVNALGGATAPTAEPEHEHEVEEPTADDDLAAMFGGMKKKKKTKKATKNFSVNLDNLPAKPDEAEASNTPPAQTPAQVEGAEGAEGSATPQPEEDTPARATEDLFGDLKKKKKKSKKDKLDELDKALAEGGIEQGETEEFQENPEVNPFAENPEAEKQFLRSDAPYPYAWLLNRTFVTLRAHNPALSGDKKKYTMVPPVVEREGSKKTAFVNCADICRRMHRDHEHVQAFLFAELGTLGNEDGAGRLIIKGRFQQQQIQNVLRKYIAEYVQCKTCRSADSELRRENRIYFVKCNTCGSQRSVAPIRSGFQAITGKRSRMRAA